jgi:asparagine N-glycosylation enzyme membrane subunit Stt3
VTTNRPLEEPDRVAAFRRQSGADRHDRTVRWQLPLIVLGTLALAACGGTGQSPSPPATSSTPSATTTSSGTSTSAAPPLQGEAASAATGDIPDNQVFLVFHNGKAGYAMKYPEGWAQQGNANQVVFRDKNNIVRAIVSTGNLPTIAAVKQDLAAQPSLKITQQPTSMQISGAHAVKVVYRTRSAPNAVTGKRVELTVDRYYLAHGGKNAVVDLGTPVGVDNVDAYRLMIESFRWR